MTRKDGRKMTRDEIDRGFSDLGLSDDVKRRSLQGLANLIPRPPEPMYVTATVANTAGQTAGVSDAELESGT
jgi:hypothetical protein